MDLKPAWRPALESEPRLVLTFKSNDAMTAALSLESADRRPVVVNQRRNYVAFTPGKRALAKAKDGDKLLEALGDSLSVLAKNYGAELSFDQRYDLESSVRPEFLNASGEAAEWSLADVIRAIKAEEAWKVADGTGVTIAVVDTGIDGSHPEFSAARRDGGWALEGDDPWTDWDGHGTMCACIAAGTTAYGGRYHGVAPGAKIMSCKTRFFDTELGNIYDELTARAKAGRKIVASNSFGFRTGVAPSINPGSKFLPALDDAIDAGVIVVFSAGNNHDLTSGDPAGCSPNTVWLYKSRADVLAVATCQLDESMWYYSSRGPGQHFGQLHDRPKPDITAPTPRNGAILYGPREQVLADGWGTSGACPQAAGLAALLLSANPSLNRTAVFDCIRNTARKLGLPPECQGSGIIDCAAAMEMIRSATNGPVA